MTKRTALVVLALLSLLGPIAEVLVTGRVDTEPFGKWSVCEAVLSMPLVYCWYYVDKREQRFRAGSLQNVGVAAFTLVGLPVYFFRSRGFRRGGLATLKSLGVWLVLTLLAGAGQWLGMLLAR